MAGIYVHVPFCRRKCIYCDFYSVGERLADWTRYVDALIAEGTRRVVDEFGDGTLFDTIYIGGGTPSLMPVEEFLRLAAFLRGLAPDYREFTVEVNPDDVTPERVEAWRRAGVNRVSMGVQSLVDEELRVIGRRHDAATALRAFDMLRNRFDNISLDLIFGLPGQTLESLRVTVEGLLRMRPEHISAYSLMYEERTAITRMVADGRLEETDENLSTEMFRMLSEILAEAGYQQYEISNYAQPGRESRHNSNYWRGIPYLGLGPGAHSYDGDRRRTSNPPDLKRYMTPEAPASGEVEVLTDDKLREVEVLTDDEVREVEVLTDDELREEMIMTRLRMREGLDLREYRNRFGDSAYLSLIAKARKSIASKDLTIESDHLRLTPNSIMISDEIILSLF